MTYTRSPRPINDNGGTSINLIPTSRNFRRRARKRGGGLGDVLEDLDKALGTNFAGGRDAALQDQGNGTTQVPSDVAPAASGGSLTYVQKPGGICKPADKHTLDVVVVFQRQMNRVAQMKGFTKIAADGDIGPGTLALFKQIQNNSGFSVIGDGSSCMGIGADLERVMASVAAFADRLGAPASVSGPSPASTPSFVSSSTGIEVPVPTAGGGSITQVLDNIPLPMKLAIGGVTVGIGYLLFFDKKRKRK